MYDARDLCSILVPMLDLVDSEHAIENVVDVVDRISHGDVSDGRSDSSTWVSVVTYRGVRCRVREQIENEPGCSRSAV